MSGRAELPSKGPVPPRGRPVLAAILAAAIAGGLFPLALPFGIDFRFGSIAVFATIRLFGPRWGVLAGILSGAASSWVWGHPGPLAVGFAEALAVGLLVQRGVPLLAAAGAFWLAGGVPLVAVLYGWHLALGADATAFLALARGLNGLADAALAGLLVHAIPVDWCRRLRLPVAPSPVRHLLFDLMAASGLLPGLAAAAVALHVGRASIESELWERLDERAERIAAALESHAPPDSEGPPLSGDWFAKEAGTGPFRVIGPAGEEVASAGNGPFGTAGSEGEVREVSKGRYLLLPRPVHRPPPLRWQDASYVREIALPGFPGWRLQVAASAAAVRDRVHTVGRVCLMVVLVLVAGAFALAFKVSRALARPLAGLAALAREIPRSLDRPWHPEWPAARTREVRTLVGQFREMAETLRRTVSDLRRRSADLEQANRALREEAAHRERLERRVRQAEKIEALGRFAGGIAHDFNNVLAAILGHAELLRDTLPEGGEEARAAGEILVAARRGRRLVEQILAFSRAAPEDRRPTELRPLVEETVRFLRASLPATTAVEVVSDGEPAVVEADPTRLQQVLLNLAANAQDAIGSGGGRIEIGLRRVTLDGEAAGRLGVAPGRYELLTVSDDGGGIEAEVLDRIFDPFFTTKPAGRGTGLGLAVVHGIVSSYGGTLEAESRPGEGTTISVYLPLADREAGPEEVPPRSAARGRGRILVVDDEPMLARLTARMLERLGYEAVPVTSGPAALDRFRRDPAGFDAVVTDETMPDLPGDRLAAELRAIRPDLPVLLTTGFSRRLEGKTAAALGVSGILVKPFGKEQLGRSLAEALAHRTHPAGDTGPRAEIRRDRHPNA
ncbi:MAG: response regulator [Acidobacteria bacterium]|nr:MAG: response regulator [Acidobacteriota bacterium]